MILFEKEYDSETIADLNRDVTESFDPDFNDLAAKIPVDQYGFQRGCFRVTIEWSDE